MQTRSKVKNTAKTVKPANATNSIVKDYSAEPFFVKKAEAAKKRVAKVGFPPAFVSGR